MLLSGSERPILLAFHLVGSVGNGRTDCFSLLLLVELQWATKVVETLLENDAFRYLSTYSILSPSSVNSLIPQAPQFNVV